MSSLIVSGAGDAASNGVYVENGTHSAVTRWTLDSTHHIVKGSGGSSEWLINSATDATGTTLYKTSSGASSLSPLGGTWTAESGAAPVPTVELTISAPTLGTATANGMTVTTPSESEGGSFLYYTLQYATSSIGPWTNYGTSPGGYSDGQHFGNSESQVVTGLLGGTTYYWRAIYHHTTGTLISATASLATLSVGAPNAPGELRVRTGGTYVEMIGPPLPSGATSLSVQMFSNGGWTTLEDGLAGGDSYTATGLTTGTDYTFRALAVSSGGSVAGPEAPVRTLTDNPATTAPNTPLAPTVDKDCEAGEVTITAPAWDTNSAHATVTMELRRSSNGGSSWTTIHTWNAANGIYVDAGLLDYATYLYAARGLNSAGNSTWSSSATVTLESATLAIAFVDPAADATLTGIATIRFTLTDAGDPPACPLDLTVTIGGLDAGTATIEEPDPCTADDEEARNATYVLEVDTRLYVQGSTMIQVQARGSDCCLNKATRAVTLSNTLKHGSFFQDVVYEGAPSPGEIWAGVVLGLENRALSTNIEQQWWMQSAVATDESPAWPLDGATFEEKDEEFSNMEAVTAEAGQSYAASGARFESAQHRYPVPRLDFPATSNIVWRTRWEPVERLENWYETLAGASKIVKIRSVSTDLFFVLSRKNDNSAAGLYLFDGAAGTITDIAEPGSNILDAACLGDKVYAILPNGTIRVYDRDTGQVVLDLTLPNETRDPAFIEVVGSVPILICVDAGETNKTKAYDLSFGAPKLLWTLTGAVTLATVEDSTLALAIGDELWTSAGGTAAPVNPYTFTDDVTALHRLGQGLDDGHVWLQTTTGATFRDAANRPTAISALSAFTGAAARERSIAATAADNKLFEQITDSGAWMLARTLTAPTVPSGLEITGVTALWQWKRADGTDALLIGTTPDALLGVLERSTLNEDSGALRVSSVYGFAIDPIPGPEE